jgi:hypothetical protein
LLRKAVPVIDWRSAQWQIEAVAGSASASKAIAPQWQVPSMRMGISV